MNDDPNAYVPEAMRQRDGYDQLLLDRYEDLQEIHDRLFRMVAFDEQKEWQNKLDSLVGDIFLMMNSAKEEIDNF